MLSSSAMYHVINGPMASAVLNNNNNDLKQELNQLNAENEQLRRKLNTKTNECEKLKIKVKETRDECENFKHLMRQLSESMNLINGTNSSGLYSVFKLIHFFSFCLSINLFLILFFSSFHFFGSDFFATIFCFFNNIFYNQFLVLFVFKVRFFFGASF